MTHEAKDFVLVTYLDDTLLGCPYEGCFWEVLIRQDRPIVNDLMSEAEQHLEESH